jgi:hypothetical protein
MKQNRPRTDTHVSALAMGGPVDQDAQKSYSPAILLVNCNAPQSASVAERLRLLDGFLADQSHLQKIETLPEVTGEHRRRGGALADNLRRFVRKVPTCDIVHCSIAEPEAWTTAALSQVLVARFFGKAVVADLGFSINEESFEHPPLVLRMILGLCTVVVVTSERAVAMLARRRIVAVQIPEALASTEFTDRKVNSVQPQILTVFPHADRVATECVVKAFRVVKIKYPRAELTILVDDQDRDSCRQLISDPDRSSITVASTGNAKEAASCYAEADMFVNSSVVGGLRPMLKAMASGLPVVSAAGYFRNELIVDRRNGLAYRENNLGDLADRIIELIEAPDLIHELTDHARLTVAEHAWSKISQRWLSCYRRLRLSRRAANITRTGHHSHQPT